ncbi:calcium-activated chloride channel regulator 3A-1-like [Amblyomma americanum]
MPTPPYDDRPFTTQVKPCGEQGEFIHLTPGFLATLTNSTAKRFINPEYVFVHEWAHFRYGVFDDYGSLNDSRYPLTFCYNNTVRLNACSSRIFFSPRTAEGKLCAINKKCRLHRNCKVIIKQMEHDPVQSSIMFMPYVANVSQFRDSRKGPCPHIPYAPNKQNEYCDQRSTWDVISKHEDFKNLPMPDMSKRIDVTFDEAQEDKDLQRRVALELDVSKSMRLLDADEEVTSSLESKHQVDFAVGNTTVVHVKQNSPSNMRIHASLIDPSGQPCQGCHESANADETTVTIPSPAMVGNRTLHMPSLASTPVKVSVRVESEPRAKDYEPILVTCKMLDLIVDKSDRAIVYAKVTKGKKLVLGAVVLATVYRPEKDPQPIKFPLRDDAEEPDHQQNDGRYFGFFVDFIGKGRYTAMVEVSNQNSTRLAYALSVSDSFLTTSFLHAATGAAPGTSFEPAYDFPELATGYPISMFEIIDDPSDDTTDHTTGTAAETMEDFQTVADCGSFFVTKDITINQVPPGRHWWIKAHVIPETPLVQLTWTWPGARLSYGKVSAMVIRAAKFFDDLKNDFENQAEITEANVVEGNLDPKPPGAKHNVTLSIPRTFCSLQQDEQLDFQFFLAVQVSNSDGLTSTSNVVTVDCGPPPVTTTAAPTTKATATRTPTPNVTTTQAEDAAKESIRESDFVASPFFWVGLSCIAAAIVIVIAVAVSAILKREEAEES